MQACDVLTADAPALNPDDLVSRASAPATAATDTGGFDPWYRALRGRGGAYQGVLSAALGRGQQVGQQGFATADQILTFGRQIGAQPGRRILDVCCGPCGPAGLLATRLGCAVVGVDLSLAALGLARQQHQSVGQVAADALRLPFRAHSFDAALVLESLASIPSPLTLLRELQRVLRPGGRVGLTAEVGLPLDAADVVGRGSLGEAHVFATAPLLASVRRAGFRAMVVEDHTAAQAGVARRFADQLAVAAPSLARELGNPMVSQLSATMEGWAHVLERRRIFKLALVLERC